MEKANLEQIRLLEMRDFGRNGERSYFDDVDVEEINLKSQNWDSNAYKTNMMEKEGMLSVKGKDESDESFTSKVVVVLKLAIPSIIGTLIFFFQ